MLRRFSHRPVARITVFLSLLLLSVGGSLLTGCNKQHFEKISRLLAVPEDYTGRDVTLKGRVTRVFDPSLGLLSLSAYQVEDGTGRIWVLSRSGAPRVGQEVGLKGRLRQDFQNLPLASEIVGGVVTEIERRTR